MISIYLFLIKTHTDCLFGIVKETKNSVFDIVCRHTFKELEYKRDDIIEIFEMVTTVSGRWSELKDNKINLISILTIAMSRLLKKKL